MASTVPSQQQGSCWNPPSCEEFACSVLACVGSLQVFPQSNNMHVRLDSRSAGSVNGCLSLRVSPLIDCQPVESAPCLSSHSSWDRLQASL